MMSDKAIAVIFSIILFFIALFFLFKQALVTAAAIMGFSLLWFLAYALCHKIELNALAIAVSKEGGKNS